MNITWKDLTIIGLGAIIILLATFKLIDFMYIKDKDIEVAVVGFIGTIIGGTLSGAITLIGVTRTIEHNQSIENRKRIKEEIMFLFPLLREIEQIRENLLFEIHENHADNDAIIRYVYKEFSSSKQLYDNARHGSLMVYSRLIKFKGTVDYFMEKIYFTKEIEYDSDIRLISGLGGLEALIKLEIETKTNMIEK
ncbi:hypothetical protein [Lysinibacillus sp. F5]|uniref:hypothetical protein n=1 Tax=Lysinibacillus sp. F5 TaxID=1700846 RepID=UPI000738CC04|nr:hypothetical protein [Lysinibacillus sp. F5]KUF37432.1 hypothetical protein AK833_00655 [Lysinibacillus sp. F5]